MSNYILDFAARVHRRVWDLVKIDKLIESVINESVPMMRMTPIPKNRNVLLLKCLRVLGKLDKFDSRVSRGPISDVWFRIRRNLYCIELHYL